MTGDGRKHTFRDHFKETVKRETGEDMGRLKPAQISFFLLKVYVNEIHNHLANYISEEDFLASTVDGPSDLGVDFIYRDGNKVEIFQVKYAKENAPAKIEDIQHFQNVLARLQSHEFVGHSKLQELVGEIDFENDVFQLRYITLARIDGQAKAQCDTGQITDIGNIGLQDRASIEYYDETELNSSLRSALQLQGGIPKDECTLHSWGASGKRSSIIEVNSGGRKSVILTVAASQIVALYERFRDSLFTLNIRNYIGTTQTNKSIIETARQSPESFFFYNNGVSCLATNVRSEKTATTFEWKAYRSSTVRKRCDHWQRLTVSRPTLCCSSG